MTYTLLKEREPLGTWLATYQIKNKVGATAEADAIAEAISKARADVPLASVEVVRVRATSPGRFSITVKRVREPEAGA